MTKKGFEKREGEEVFAQKVSGDCWNMPKFTIAKQVSGKYYFTNERIVFLASGLIGTQSVSFEIEMKDIASVKPCMTPPFFPFGILVTTKKKEKYKLSILGRKKYIEWITNHINK